MGKVSSKIWSKGMLGGFGKPRVQPALAPLVGWKREDLDHTYRILVYRNCKAICRKTFGELMNIPSRDLSEAAWQALRPKKGKVDSFSLFSAMVAVSNQNFISRVTFLFSIFDLDGNGEINRIEFFLALRSIFVGLCAFFENSVMPSELEIEASTKQVFDQIDYDHSGAITIGEILAFAYRSPELQALLECSPEESSDNRVYEEVIPFLEKALGSTPMLSDEPFLAEETMQRNNSLTPRSGCEPTSLIGRRFSDGPSTPRRGCLRRRTGKVVSRPYRPPEGLTKAQAWLLWRSYEMIGHHGNVKGSDLQVVLRDPQRVRGIIVGAYDSAHNVSSSGVGTLSAAIITGNKDAASESSALSAMLQRHLVEKESIFCLKHLASSSSVSLRGFLCVMLPHFSPADIEICINWCRSFAALDLVHTILADDSDTQEHNLQEFGILLQVLDLGQTGEGQELNEEVLTRNGVLTSEQAKRFVSFFDKDTNGKVDIQDARRSLLHMDTALKIEFRSSFAARSSLRS
jgi:Ca2+-binding EF-hand superfamily protein